MLATDTGIRHRPKHESNLNTSPSVIGSLVLLGHRAEHESNLNTSPSVIGSLVLLGRRGYINPNAPSFFRILFCINSTTLMPIKRSPGIVSPGNCKVNAAKPCAKPRARYSEVVSTITSTGQTSPAPPGLPWRPYNWKSRQKKCQDWIAEANIGAKARELEVGWLNYLAMPQRRQGNA